MQNSMKKRGLSEKRQTWVETLNEKPNLGQALTCFAARGLAAQDHIEQLSGLTTKQVRSALDDLTKGFYGGANLLRSETVHLEGRRGRPQVVYLLTADGAAILSHLSPEESISAPQVEDQVELAHALMEMEVFVLARQVGLKAMIEHVLRFEDKHSIRADVLIQPESGSSVIIEMEQAARPGDIPRILNKLKQYAMFFQSANSKGIEPKIRLLFNLAPSDTMTIKRWSLVLGELCNEQGNPPYRLFWQPVLNFLQKPEWNGTAAFEEIIPAPERADAPAPFSKNVDHAIAVLQPGSQLTVSSDLLPPLLQSFQPADLQTLNIIMRALAAQNVKDQQNLVFSNPARGDFFDLMRTIYQVSHYPDGPVRKHSALPVLSLVLLYRYLNMHQNQALLQAVQQGREEVRKSMNRGINLFRDVYSRLCWTFLRYHGFGRGGPLEVTVRVPMLSGDQSEITVEVKVLDPDLIIGSDGLLVPGDLKLTEDALSWVLGAVWLYGEELGLINRQARKGKG